MVTTGEWQIKAGFLNGDSIVIWGWVVLWCWGLPCTCEMFGRISILHMPVDSTAPPSPALLLQVVITKHIFSYCQMVPGTKISPVENHGIKKQFPL